MKWSVPAGPAVSSCQLTCGKVIGWPALTRLFFASAFGNSCISMPSVP